MQVEVMHRLKPEIDGDAQFEVTINEREIHIRKEKDYLIMSHVEFLEMIHTHNAWNSATTSAKSRMQPDV